MFPKALWLTKVIKIEKLKGNARYEVKYNNILPSFIWNNKEPHHHQKQIKKQTQTAQTTKAKQFEKLKIHWYWK